MSVKAMAAVWDADLPRPEKFVLLALADHADHEGGHISPSLGRVALKTGYSYQKVLAIVKGMRETGIIESVGESEYRTGSIKFVLKNYILFHPIWVGIHCHMVKKRYHQKKWT